MYIKSALGPAVRLGINKRLLYDFRSDTVTRPCAQMLQKMHDAPVGDDVMLSDPSVTLLQKRVAALTGMEDALFCASGTMSNQLAIAASVGGLCSVIGDKRSHVFKYEATAIAYHARAKTIEIDCQKNGGTGLITAELVDAHGVWTRDVHLAQTKLIVLENTIDGHVMPLKNIKRIIDLAAQRDCLVHMDGARIWHAAVATNVPVLEMCTGLNSVSLCFSKGLGAPVGSVLAGSSELIDKARYLRKIWGGGWRQAGGLAAACIYALDNNIDRLKIDHKVAKELSDELRHRGYKVEQSETNMVWVENNDPDIEAKMDKRGVNVFGGAKMRIVVHFQNHAGVSALLDGFPMIKDS